MSLRLIQPPAVEPITLDEAKVQARIDHDDDDALLEGFIGAAREWCEQFTSRVFITQTWRLTLDRFPVPGVMQPGSNHMVQPIHLGLAPSMIGPLQPVEIELRRSPVRSIDKLSYIGLGGASVLLTDQQYIADLEAEPARVFPPASGSWPSTASRPAAVTIEFTAGYGDAPADVPKSIKFAILIYVAWLYENRGDTGDADVPQAVKALLRPYRLVSFGER
jgi:hypothetical protein